MSGQSESEYVTLTEAAELLGVTRVTMRQMAARYGLESFALPRDARVKLFRRADVLALNQPRTVPKAPAAYAVAAVAA